MASDEEKEQRYELNRLTRWTWSARGRMNDLTPQTEWHRLAALLDLASIVKQELARSGHAVRMQIVLPTPALSQAQIALVDEVDVEPCRRQH
jgi:hypothetical protein